jgi:Divergent InlB B-repeat domain
VNNPTCVEKRPTYKGRIRFFALAIASLMSVPAWAQQSPFFTPGNLVVTVEGCGVYGGTCTQVPNGTGNGTGNSSAGGYGDNQAAPLTLFQYTPNGAASVTYVNSLVLPQTGLNANPPVSGEYGSSSEGTLQLSGPGQYLTLMGYGINAAAFDAAYYPNPGFTGNAYGAAPSGALAQSGSLTGQSYTAVPRVVTLIDPYGNINSSTALYNIFDTNNPRSVYTADGLTYAYVSGQGTGCDMTGGVFYVPLGAPDSSPTAITGGDAVPTSSCVSSGYTGSLIAQDTRTVQIYDNTLYISIDSTEGKSDNRALIGTLGTPPATSLYSPTDPPTGDTGGPNLIPGLGNTGGTGKVTVTSGENSNGNAFNAGLQINISPSNYFFASPSVLYVADTGSPKQTSASSTVGDGGLQKWINSEANGSGTWSLAYTLYQGLNLVENPTSDPSDTSGTTGLYGLTGTVSGGTVYLYATNYTIADLDPTYLYGITDTLSTTTNPGTSFTLLDTAPPDSNFKGVSLAPSLPAGSATITSSPSGLAISTSGTGCEPGTYTTPVTLIWTQGSSCTLSVVTPQGGPGTEYGFTEWQDGTTGTSDTVTAPTTSAVYSATFSTAYQLTTSATMGGTVSAGGYYAAGTNAVITATPSTGYYFVNFTGSTTSTSNPLTVLMSGPQSITANFAPQTAPTVTFTGAPAVAPEYSTFTVTATTDDGTTPTITASGSCSISGTTVTITAPTGTCTLMASWPASGTYLAATATQSTTAEGPAPTITWATPAAITYGTAVNGTQLDATASYNGNNLAGTFTYTPAKGTVLGAGTQTLSVLFTPNTTAFSPVTASVMLQVNPATTKITWTKPAAITYGTALSSAQLDATASVPGTFSYSPGVGTVLPAGAQTLSVTFTPTDSTDYQRSTDSVTITVDKAEPEITWAAPAPISYGMALSSTQLDATATVPGTFSYSPAAGAVPAAGTDTLSTTFTPTDTTDYTTAKASVSLLVTSSTPTITWANPAAITYGTALSGTQLDATATYNGANVAGTFTYSPAKGTVLGAGTQTLSVLFTPSNTSNYNPVSASATLQVNQATPKVTWAKPAAITYGTALSSTQLDATASVPGTFVYSPGAGAVLPEGTQTLSVTFTPTDTTDYTTQTATTTIDVKP